MNAAMQPHILVYRINNLCIRLFMRDYKRLHKQNNCVFIYILHPYLSNKSTFVMASLTKRNCHSHRYKHNAYTIATIVTTRLLSFLEFFRTFFPQNLFVICYLTNK